MKQTIEFICKKYKWGWSVWIKGDDFKKLIANKLKSEYEVHKYVYSINNKGSYRVVE